MKKKLVQLFFLFFCTLNLAAQQGIFTFYSVNEGLAQSTVTCMYRDTFGLLWVGTGEGLSLFNGYEFKNFKSRFNDSLSLSNNRIRSIRPSLDGKNVWVGTEDGVNCFSREKAQLVKKVIYPEHSGLISNPLYYSDTAYWFLVSSKGIFKKKKGEQKPKQISDEIYQFRINPLLTNGEFMYQTVEKKLESFSVLTETLRSYELPEGLHGKNIYTALETQNGSIILGSENGLWMMEKNTGKIQRYPFGDKNWDDTGKLMNAVCIDTKGRIWMAVTGEGLYVYDPRVKKVRPVGWEQSGLSVRNKLEYVMCLNADPYGIVWAGTDGYGLVKIITDRIFFGEEYLSPLVTDTCHWFTKSFYKDNTNRLWVGTYREGIKLIDYNKGTIKTIFPDFLNSEKIFSITAICPAPGNALFIGTNKGFFLLDTLSWKSKQIAWDEQPEVGKTVTCLLKRKDGTVLVGTNTFLFYVKETSGEMHLEKFFQSQIYTSAVAEANSGDVIVGTVYKGIYLLDQEGQLKDSLIFKKNNFLPASTLINSFSQNGNDSWLVGSSIGLIEFSADLKIKKIFTDLNGLPDNMVYGVVKLPDHRFFISTGKGVSIFDPQKRIFENYSEKDGLKSDECNTGALYFSADGTIYVGGVNGFDCRKYPFTNQTIIHPKIYFEKQFKSDPVNQGRYPFPFFELNYLDNTFSFQLWQTDFTFSDRTTYHYQLKGFDPTEVIEANNRFVRYVDVSPDEYTFVSSVSFPGYVSPDNSSLFSLTIIPPYWKSTWFRILAIVFSLLFIASLVYFIIHARYKKAMQKLEVQRQMERVRIRISGDIHDDIGAGLTRIALSSDLLSRQLEGNNPMKSKIVNVAASARDLSQSLKEVVWSVKPEYDQLDSMVKYFKGYCGELFEDTEIAFSFHVIGILQSTPVSPEIRRNLFLIMKEACNNAMKHSGATRVEAKFQYEKGHIRFEIRDNGCGMNEGDKIIEINSSGMKNMQRRATDINFDFSIGKNEPGGCVLAVSGFIS